MVSVSLLVAALNLELFGAHCKLGFIIGIGTSQVAQRVAAEGKALLQFAWAHLKWSRESEIG